MSTKFRTRFQIFSNDYTTKNSKGRDYLIVPGVIVREQVMNTYLVPAEELEMAEVWNGTPITVRHPKKNNGSANVPEPDVAVVGRFYNATWDEDEKRITGEYWIDVSEAMQYVEGQYILNSIYSGQVLETSTGYWASEEFTPGEFNGKNYETIQHNLKPDHIAILVDELGACSVADGCGVNRNSLLHNLYTNAVELNGGPGSGFWGHLGRPGQVGGAAPTGKSTGKKKPSSKRLKRGIKAYYVAGKDEGTKKKKSGFKTKVSLMSKSKAGALFNRMAESTEPVILEVNLKTGTPYESLSANSITVSNVPGSNITIITYETLQGRKTETFSNAADCNCTDAIAVVDNEDSITQKVDKIRKAFYEQVQKEDMVYSCYIRDYFDDHVIVEMGGMDKLYKAGYTENGGDYTFQEPESWTRVKYVQEYVDAPASTVQNVLGDLPARAKKLWEKVYQAWLKDHPKDKAGASKRAWGAVKQAGWTKGKDGAWVKSNSVVKGVPIIDVRTTKKHTLSNWTVRNSNQPKESSMSMKLSLKTLFDALRNKGVVINTEDGEIDETELLELEVEQDEEDDDEAEGTEQNARVPVAKSPFTKQQEDTLRKLAKMDFAALENLAKQLPVVMEIAQNAEAERTSKKTGLIASIKTNSAQPFSDEELNAMSLPILTKLNAQYNVDYSGLTPALYDFSTNMQDDEETLALPSIALNDEQEA